MPEAQVCRKKHFQSFLIRTHTKQQLVTFYDMNAGIKVSFSDTQTDLEVEIVIQIYSFF